MKIFGVSRQAVVPGYICSAAERCLKNKREISKPISFALSEHFKRHERSFLKLVLLLRSLC